MPLVSVIIPTYFRNDDLEEAIQSALTQTYSNIEIIIVDDSGEEHAKQVCNQFDVIYIPKKENEGMMSAWNDGLKKAKGDYIQILDDDDVLFPEKIKKQLDLLTQSDHVGVAHCGIRWDFGVDEFPNPEMSGNVLPEVLTLDTSPCVTSTLLIDYNVLKRIYPMDVYQGAADDVLKIELSQQTQFDFVDDILVLRGTGDDNVSTSMGPVNANKRILKEYSKVYKQFRQNVRQEAISKTLYREGCAHLAENAWSLKAILCFARSIYVAPTRSTRSIIMLPLSLGGRPAVSLFEQAGTRIKRSLQSKP